MIMNSMISRKLLLELSSEKDNTVLVINYLIRLAKERKGGKKTLSMLQITKAKDVVPMILYLSGIFFHGGQFLSKPTSPDRVSPSEPAGSDSFTWSPVSTPATLSLSLTFSFSLMLQHTRNPERCLEGNECK